MGLHRSAARFAGVARCLRFVLRWPRSSVFDPVSPQFPLSDL